MTKIYIIHENEEWTVHLTKRLEELGYPYVKWFMSTGDINLAEAPPEGVFYNRMSASSHTRGNRFAPELTGGVLAWLERHGRTVVNGSRALQLELSKVSQYMALQALGIRTPKTVAAVGKEQIVKAAQSFQGQSVITKHNRAGKGLGVQLFHGIDPLREYVYSDQFEEPVDGVTLIQEYIQAPEPYITRCEFVGGKFLYAVQVDTSEGFELCPAEACQIDDLACPVGEESNQKDKFTILNDFNEPIIEQYERFLAQNDIQVAGIEFIRDAQGDIYTYDVNTNTNYNPEAEAVAQKFGMLELGKYLGSKLNVTPIKAD